MPFYVADYMADTAHLSTIEHGAYLLLIMSYWRQGGLPNDDSRLARIARMSAEEWASVRSTIVDLFSEGWAHKRIDSELAKAQEKSIKAISAGKMSAIARSKGTLATVVERTLNECSTDVPTDCQLSQPQSQPLLDIINPSGLIAEAITSAGSIRLVKDRQKLAELRARIRVIGQDWNAMASDYGIPQILGIDPGDDRERRVLALIRSGFDFPGLLTIIRSSSFLRGDKGSTPCTFDWVLKPKNLRKIMEGNYTDEIRKTPEFRPAYASQHR